MQNEKGVQNVKYLLLMNSMYLVCEPVRCESLGSKMNSATPSTLLKDVGLN